jgi:PhnB protein
MTQGITPYLFYEDAVAALGFLSRAFGFEETMRSALPDGRVAHAEMRLEDGVLFLGAPDGDYRGPRKLGTSTCCIYAYVADVDAHYEQARAAGAEVVEEPSNQEYGDRRYHARDLDGHDWYFAQPLSNR